MQTHSLLRYARLSPQKGRLVADQIRGKPVDQALATLRFSNKKAAAVIRKVLSPPSPTLRTISARTWTNCGYLPSLWMPDRRSSA